MLATLYVPPGSVVTGLTLDGRAVSFGQGTELGLVWLEAQVVLEPGQSAELVATFVEPAGSDGQVERIAQPLVREETFTATGCRAGTVGPPCVPSSCASAGPRRACRRRRRRTR